MANRRFDPDTDYSALISDAVTNGDMQAAARYEQLRNEKIDTLGLDYAKTNDYAQYYKDYDPSVDYSVLMGEAAAGKDNLGAAEYERQRNEKIDAENKQLETDEGVENQAREEYGWVKNDEKATVVVNSGDSGSGDMPSQVDGSKIEPPHTWYYDILDIIFRAEV